MTNEPLLGWHRHPIIKLLVLKTSIAFIILKMWGETIKLD